MPTKLYPGCPLYLHKSGLYAKKIRLKTHYFGRDLDAALALYAAQRDDLHAGRPPRPAGGPTIRDLCNRFLAAQKLRLTSGAIGSYTWRDYFRVCETVVGFFGLERAVEGITPEDFGRFRASLARTRGPVALANAINRVRIVFRWGAECDILDKAVKFGPNFRKPGKKELRKAKREGGSRVFSAADIRALLASAGQPMKAMILLGVNCGFGNTDVAELPLKILDLDGGWVNYPRGKTAEPRRCPLWPETIAALRKAIARRPAAKLPADAGLVFLTHRGARWIRGKIPEGSQLVHFHDYVGREFDKLAKRVGVKRRGSFYNLRHVYRTVAAKARDKPAADLIMGHTPGDMAAEYIGLLDGETVSTDDARLRAVTDLVRAWLFAEPAKPSA